MSIPAPASSRWSRRLERQRRRLARPHAPARPRVRAPPSGRAGWAAAQAPPEAPLRPRRARAPAPSRARPPRASRRSRARAHPRRRALGCDDRVGGRVLRRRADSSNAGISARRRASSSTTRSKPGGGLDPAAQRRDTSACLIRLRSSTRGLRPPDALAGRRSGGLRRRPRSSVGSRTRLFGRQGDVRWTAPSAPAARSTSPGISRLRGVVADDEVLGHDRARETAVADRVEDLFDVLLAEVEVRPVGLQAVLDRTSPSPRRRRPPACGSPSSGRGTGPRRGSRGSSWPPGCPASRRRREPRRQDEHARNATIFMREPHARRNISGLAQRRLE